MDKQLYSKNHIIGVDEITSLPLLNTSDSTSSTMKQLINNQPSVVVFLRHFAWLPWRQHVKQIEDHKVRFQILVYILKTDNNIFIY